VIRFLVQATEKPFTFTTLTGAKFTNAFDVEIDEVGNPFRLGIIVKNIQEILKMTFER
jgi:hypothetical protein